MILVAKVDGNKNCAVVRQKFLKQFEPRIHHAQPLIVSGKVFAFLADDFTEPAFDLRRIDVVVVNPALVACIVRGVYVDTLDATFVLRQQRF